jgi:hypothetical protein
MFTYIIHINIIYIRVYIYIHNVFIHILPHIIFTRTYPSLPLPIFRPEDLSRSRSQSDPDLAAEDSFFWFFARALVGFDVSKPINL